MSARWDNHFLHLARLHAEMSKDPNTRVGCVIVGPDREIRATGFNGFPRLICDSPERLNNRDVKLQMIVHAECNAICAAARVGVPLLGCTLYLAATDDTGAVWGGPPCTRCTVHALQAGITQVVSRPRKAVPSRWHADLDVAEALLAEAGVTYREVAEVMSLLDPRSHDISREAVERCIQHLEREQRDPGVQRTLRALLADRDNARGALEILHADFDCALADQTSAMAAQRDAAVRDLSAAREILRRLRSWPPSMSCAGTMEGFQAIQAAWLRERREAEAAADAVLAAQPAAKAGVTDREVPNEA